MRLTVFATAAVSSAVALVAFAGAALASATIDLIWIDVSNVDTNGNPICLRPANRNCPQLGTALSSVAVTDSITLGVIVTAGPNGLQGAGVSVDYGDALPKLSVTDFRRSTTTVPLQYLPGHLGEPNDLTSGWVQNINALCCGPLAGIGLPAAATAYLGTVTFHKDFLVNGIFEIAVGTDGPDGTDAVLSLVPLGTNISGTTSFNSAFLVNVSAEPPGCGAGPAFMEIEVNALRAGGKTIVTGPDDTTKVTAKARILKGTAPSGTTLVTTLSIEALDGGELIGSGSQPDITLEVGKGGKGASIVVSTEQCNSGFIEFVAKFSGVDAENDICVGSRTLQKACR